MTRVPKEAPYTGLVYLVYSPKQPPRGLTKLSGLLTALFSTPHLTLALTLQVSHTQVSYVRLPVPDTDRGRYIFDNLIPIRTTDFLRSNHRFLNLI